MAIHQTKKQSDLEKRLQLLRKQIYGKSSFNESGSPLKESRSQRVMKIQSNHDPLAQVKTSTSDLAYLRQDLLKIFLFASMAIGLQVIIFALLKIRILNINFL